jgi:hypothetical protein
MADIDDDADQQSSSEGGNADDQAAQFEAELQRQAAQLPPELYDTLKPLLLLASVANHMLLGYPEDPVPQALENLLGYNQETLQTVTAAQDTPSLGRVMAAHTLELFDFIMVSRLVFESSLDAPLRAYLMRHSKTDDHDDDDDDFSGPRSYLLSSGEALLDNITKYLTGANPDINEELHMRRLQSESIFARLDDTLRPFYPIGLSPTEQQADALDAADEAEDQQEPAVYITFNEGQRVTLGTALRLPYLLAELGETPFALALAGVGHFRRKALERLANRLAESDPNEPFGLAWSELLRLYQAAQVCALSTVTDVLATGSLEDMMYSSAEGQQTPEEAAAFARHAREVMTTMMSGFIEVVEVNHPNDAEITAARAEISQLAELLME